MLVGQNIGPFHIEKEIGSGAMGTVYRATYTPTGLRVAIKVLAAAYGATNTNAADRFKRETKILKELRHPNIVRFIATNKLPDTDKPLDTSKPQGPRFYAMEYIEGESLDHLMARRDRMTWEEVVTLGKQLCSALQHAHEKGVIHRDLKPSNLMILPDGTLKLTDFGIAKNLDLTALTEANCTVGTASYMSPEQCRGERDLTLKSDLYSLGIVFYELVTGRKPFNADNAMAMFILHVSGTFERPSRLVPELPVWFDNLICQLLEKDPEKRPLDAAMVANALNAIQEKVEAQLSAGVEVVRSRRIDRPRGSRKIDEQDRDAARALKGGKRKLKRSLRKPRFYERAWFAALGVVALLLAVGTFTYFAFLAPPSLDTLHAQSKRLMDTNDADKWDKALDGPLKSFKMYYSDAQGEKADQMRRWESDVKYRQCYEQIKTHLERTKKGKPHFAADDSQEIAFPAAIAEEDGDFEKAEKGWVNLKENGTSAWRVFAGRKLDEMKQANEIGDRLQNELDKIKEFHRELDKDNPDLPLLTALRYEQFGDYFSASEVYEKVKNQTANDEAGRVQYLFAAKKVVELKPEVKKVQTGRAQLIDEHLKEAQAPDTKPADAYVTLLNIIALYKSSAEPDIKARVAQARDLAPGLRKKLQLPEPSEN